MGTLIKRMVNRYKEYRDLQRLKAGIRWREQNRQKMYDERTR